MATSEPSLSRRERQIMDALYALGAASAVQVTEYLREPRAHHSIRVTLGNLEKKGHVRHDLHEGRNIYSPVVPSERARRTAMRRLVRTFFQGATSQAILAFLDQSGERLSPEELDAIARRIREAQK